MKITNSKIIKYLLLICGIIFVVVGAIGIILPLLPTTPFILLALLCFSKSSPRFYNSLLNNRIFGDYISSYREGRGIPRKIKIVSLLMLWFSILFSIALLYKNLVIVFILFCIAVIITIHILKLKTCDKNFDKS
jgi:uncharacterized membrane protein YbaN (DUF454 family)